MIKWSRKNKCTIQNLILLVVEDNLNVNNMLPYNPEQADGISHLSGAAEGALQQLEQNLARDNGAVFRMNFTYCKRGLDSNMIYAKNSSIPHHA